MGGNKKSCLSLHDSALLSARRCTKTAYYFNQMLSDISDRLMRA